MGFLRFLLAAALALFCLDAKAQGTLPLALQQQFSFSGCASTPTTAACGQPLNGGLLYFYQVGTVATPQNSFQDTGLTLLNPWPLPLDANGRVPPFYLASGSVHVRLTDSSGVQQFDVPSMLVIGPSGGGGGGSSIDPTTIAQTGDIKFRPTADTITGWVKLNQQSIGSATSGATQRANADTQALYVYLWNTFSSPSGNTICAVTGGLGANALADFAANKAMNTLNFRGRIMAGLDGMGNGRINTIPDSVVANAGPTGTTGDSYAAAGGFASQAIGQPQLPNVSPSISATFSGNSVTPTTASTSFSGNSLANHIAQSTGAFTNTLLTTSGGISVPNCNGTCSDLASATPSGTVTVTMNAITPTGGISGTVAINGNVSQQNLIMMNPFILGTWYQKL